jgi:hypothetical protein
MLLALAAALASSPPATTNMAASSVNSGGSSQTSAPAAVSRGPAATPEKVYCTSGTISGSRIVKKECKTKAQWAKDGVDVNDLMNSEQE